MKGIFRGFAVLALLFAVSSAYAFTSGSTGVDGAFNPEADVEVQLPDSGVLNYTTVNIPQGVAVTFKKNSGNTPIYILASEDITISGTINVSGTDAVSIAPGKGGSGGYEGGNGNSMGSGGNGLGPGGGGISPQSPTNVIMAQATFNIQTAMYYEGEKIEKVMVASAIGKGSDVTYITERGRQVSTGELMARAVMN